MSGSSETGLREIWLLLGDGEMQAACGLLVILTGEWNSRLKHT